MLIYFKKGQEDLHCIELCVLFSYIKRQDTSFVLQEGIRYQLYLYQGVVDLFRLIEKFHVCDICGLKLTRPSHLRKHKLRRHKENSEVDKNLVTSLSCEICGLEYRSQGAMRRHMRIHTIDEKSHLAAIDKLCGKREVDEKRVHQHIVPLRDDLERECDGQEKPESMGQQKSSRDGEGDQQQNGQQNIYDGKDGRKAEGDNRRILPSNDAFVNEVSRYVEVYKTY